MASPAGSSGSGGGSTANVYTPANQPGADQWFWQALNPMFQQGVNGANLVSAMGNPTYQAYSAAYPLINRFIGGGGGGKLPAGADPALAAAQKAAGYGNQLFGQTTGGSTALNNAALTGLPDLSKILGNAFDPGYSQVVNKAQNNPYFNTAIQGALQGAGMGRTGAGSLMSDAGTLRNLMGPITQPMGALGRDARTLSGAGRQILNTGFDPQSQLFNRMQGQLLDQSNVANSMAGLGGTPYGASNTSNALGNFDINWQNNLLNRQATAAGAANPLFQGAGALDTTRANLGLDVGSLAGQAGNLTQAAPGLATSSAAAPSGVYGNNLGQILASLNARNAAGIQGGSGFNSLLGGVGGGLSSASGLGLGGANALANLGGLPYNMGTTIGSNALSGLSSLAGLGNSAFTGLPQQAIQDLQSYMQLGQSASGISGQLGQMGINQLGAGIGGALSGANSLFGANGLLNGGGGIAGLSGLFGASGAGAVSPAALGIMGLPLGTGMGTFTDAVMAAAL